MFLLTFALPNIFMQIKKSKKKERETGIEPATPTLARWCSTAEPLAHFVALATKSILHQKNKLVNNFLLH